MENVSQVSATVTPPSGAVPGTIAATHTFALAGVYLVTLTVSDGDGGTDEVTVVNDDAALRAMVVIYDPSGGFVTGGGWIWSPEGAYVADPSLTGKASFGFVSKYKKGATTPNGNTEFHFKAGDLKFHSSEYEWLVVAGTKAQYKGVGTINGEGFYGFLLTAIDGDPKGNPDALRMKIWDKANNDQVVYDNKIGVDETADDATVLGGGSIVIHKIGEALQLATSGIASPATAIWIDQADLAPIVAQAMSDWQDAGIGREEVERIGSTPFASPTWPPACSG